MEIILLFKFLPSVGRTDHYFSQLIDLGYVATMRSALNRYNFGVFKESEPKNC